MKPPSYWERRRSFWSTPKGAAIYAAVIIVLLIGGLIALNLYSSPFPIIEYFRSSPTTIGPEENSNLSWAVIGANTVEIRPGIGKVELRGSRQVSPSSNIIYTLIALNGTRNRSAEAIVRVE
jgi:hypothetical protein